MSDLRPLPAFLKKNGAIQVKRRSEPNFFVQMFMGTSKNSRYPVDAIELPANDSGSFPFRFINVHCRVLRDWQREQFFKVPLYQITLLPG
jgi:hypothetical protein